MRSPERLHSHLVSGCNSQPSRIVSIELIHHQDFDRAIPSPSVSLHIIAVAWIHDPCSGYTVRDVTATIEHFRVKDKRTRFVWHAAAFKMFSVLTDPVAEL